ncbi:MAG: Tm-1-like ATP-binding domain-containing protein [Syntrophales bacterium]
MSRKCVAVIGTLDTKGPEYSFLLTCLRYHGLEPVLIDISLYEINTDFDPEYTVNDVARLAGEDFSSVAALNKIEAAKIMVKGAKEIVQKMQSEGRLDGIIAMGGANGTLLAGEIMKSLRVYLPKFIVSVVAAGDPRVNVGTKDIVLVNSVSDICLNRFTRRIMANATAAFAGMILLAQEPVIDSEKKLVAGTMLGLNQTFVLGVKELIEKKPFEMVIFHTNGLGGVALEDMVEEGIVEGILDLTLNEQMNYLNGGVFSSGPTRMDAALKKGLPMVIAPGCLDFINHWGRNIPAQFQKRTFIYHNTQNTLMRTIPEETFRCGCYVGEKLNRSLVPVKILIPLEGVSANDRVGGPHGQTIDGRDGGSWHCSEAVHAFSDGLQQTVRNPKINTLVLQTHINDERFIQATAEAFIEVMPALTPQG